VIDGGLRGIFRKYLPVVDWTTVETGWTGGGVPDSNGCCEGKEFWVEYKKTKAYVVNFEPLQIAWLMRRARHGGRVFIAVRRQVRKSKRRSEVDELWVFNGAAASTVARKGLHIYDNKILLGKWEGGPKNWHWDQVLQILKTKSPPRS
jgi:hypothetical protein